MHNKLNAKAVAHLAKMIEENIHMVEIKYVIIIRWLGNSYQRKGPNILCFHTLSLGSNKIGNEGAKALADALVDNTFVESIQ